MEADAAGSACPAPAAVPDPASAATAAPPADGAGDLDLLVDREAGGGEAEAAKATAAICLLKADTSSVIWSACIACACISSRCCCSLSNLAWKRRVRKGIRNRRSYKNVILTKVSDYSLRTHKNNFQQVTLAR